MFSYASGNPANTIHCPNAGLMLARRLRRRPNINSALGQCIVFAGKLYTAVPWPAICGLTLMNKAMRICNPKVGSWNKNQYSHGHWHLFSMPQVQSRSSIILFDNSRSCSFLSLGQHLCGSRVLRGMQISRSLFPGLLDSISVSHYRSLNPVTTTRSCDRVMLGQRRRRWTNITPTQDNYGRLSSADR